MSDPVSGTTDVIESFFFFPGIQNPMFGWV